MEQEADPDFKPELQESHQKTNALNRQNFLHLLSLFRGRRAVIRMFECSKMLMCRIEACDAQFKFVAVSDLETPIGLQKRAVLRVDDILEICVPKE